MIVFLLCCFWSVEGVPTLSITKILQIHLQHSCVFACLVWSSTFITLLGFGGFLASGIVKLYAVGTAGNAGIEWKAIKLHCPSKFAACMLLRTNEIIKCFNFSFRHRKPLGRQRGPYFHHATLAPGPQNILTINIQQPLGFMSSTLHSGQFSTWSVVLCFCEAVVTSVASFLEGPCNAVT